MNNPGTLGLSVSGSFGMKEDHETPPEQPTEHETRPNTVVNG
jgi:hypothetical protein